MGLSQERREGGSSPTNRKPRWCRVPFFSSLTTKPRTASGKILPTTRRYAMLCDAMRANRDMRSTILPNPSQLVIGAGIRSVTGSTLTGDTTHPLPSSTPLPCIVPDHTRPCPISIFERVIPWSELAVLLSSVPRSIIKLSDEGWLGVDERSTKGASGTGLPMVVSTRLPSSTQRKVRKSVMDIEGDDNDDSIA